MRKIIFFVTFISVFFAVYSRVNAAEDNFDTNIAVNYVIDTSGKTTITHNIRITNKTDGYFAKTYSLTLSQLNPANVTALQSGAALPTTISSDNDNNTSTINVELHPVVGKGNTLNLTIEFNDNSIAQKSGEVWEVNIPKLGNGTNYESYTVSLSTPQEFGKPAYISPEPDSVRNMGGMNIYNFANRKGFQTPVTAAFGTFQVYSFDLTYHLNNPLAVRSSVSVAIPPDTPYQKVTYTSIDPRSEEIKKDEDGNYLATFNLDPGVRLDVRTKGFIQLYPSPRDIGEKNIGEVPENLAATNYWEVDSDQIKNLAEKLKTPREIYDYVRTTLSYDYSRVKPNVERLGALGALQSPHSAICMEFTDLFVAIARAAGIPAREVEGYAYTQNPKLQPLSLVADVLHAWPEYWDKTQDQWIAIDPTWGSTTGGEDFFSKLDLRHITFVIHSRSATLPYPPGSYKLGSSPQKDVYVNLASEPDFKAESPTIEITTIRSSPITNMKLEAKIVNKGGVALFNEPYAIYFDDKKAYSGDIPFILPFSSYTFDISVPFSLFGRSTPKTVSATFSGANASASTFKNMLAAIHLIIVGFMLVSIIFIFYVRLIKKIERGN